jgi:hypothetical protein
VRYVKTVVAGDVLCGRGGPDRVQRMEGGEFRGNGGRDRVRALRGGEFAGGKGLDSWTS